MGSVDSIRVPDGDGLYRRGSGLRRRHQAVSRCFAAHADRGNAGGAPNRAGARDAQMGRDQRVGDAVPLVASRRARWRGHQRRSDHPRRHRLCPDCRSLGRDALHAAGHRDPRSGRESASDRSSRMVPGTTRSRLVGTGGCPRRRSWRAHRATHSRSGQSDDPAARPGARRRTVRPILLVPNDARRRDGHRHRPGRGQQLRAYPRCFRCAPTLGNRHCPHGARPGDPNARTSGRTVRKTRHGVDLASHRHSLRCSRGSPHAHHVLAVAQRRTDGLDRLRHRAAVSRCDDRLLRAALARAALLQWTRVSS